MSLCQFEGEPLEGLMRMRPLFKLQNPIRWMLIQWVRLAMRLGFNLTVVWEDETLKKRFQAEKEAFIFAGSHTGWLDCPALVSALQKPIGFMVGEAALSWGWLKSILRYWPHLAIGKGQERFGLRQAIQMLKSGQSLVLFPEGRLTPDGELLPFQAGAEMMQKHSGAAIIPFYISGGFQAWGWRQPLTVFSRITVYIGSPLEHPNKVLENKQEENKNILASETQTQRLFDAVSALKAVC
jgi:1-acyl-sn-glycerol-3-phosphate acyltransferase